MSSTMTPYRSSVPVSRDSFAQLALAEFTKLRTVRGWVVGLVVGALLIVGIGFLSAAGSRQSCAPSSGAAGDPASGQASGQTCGPGTPTLGPGGEPVSDSFSFLNQQLNGDGIITVRVTALSEQVMPAGGGPGSPAPPWEPGVVPWAKAGLIVKANTTQGSPYAAVMATAMHGVRMQYNFTHDVAGSVATVSKTSPRWLRLTRSGNTVTGYESLDADTWTKVGVATLSGLPTSVQVGMFVASPDHDVTTTAVVIGTSTQGGPSRASATFDDVTVQGQASGSWRRSLIGNSGSDGSTTFTQSGGAFTVSGSGDIAPMASDGGDNTTISGSLIGVFVGLIAIVVIAALFITAEYRSGLIRTTLIASPRRGRVLAAKAVVLASVVFVLGLVASAFTMWFVDRLRRNNGIYIPPASAVTEIRVLAGTAGLLALASVLALAVGTIVRRSATAVAAVIALVVLPYILGVSAIGAMQWLLRVTPAAGFAVQQTLHRYPQVDGVYIASAGYYPLSPWGGFAVLFGWTAVALGFALFLLRRRDA